jgi:pimeloyl-ACP methyl ester carboxylesterase
MQIAFDLEDSVTSKDGPEVVYRKLGQGETMFVLHGGSGSYRHWLRNLPELARHYTCYVPDLPGFGDSGDVSNEITLDNYIHHTREALELMCPGGGPFHMVGFSYGGMIGTGVCAQLHDRVRALTVLGPGGMGKPTSGSPNVNLLRPRPEMSEEELLQVHRTNLENAMLFNPAVINEETVTLHRANIERARFRNWGLSWLDVVVGWLAESKFPAQYLIGEHDAMARPNVAHRVGRVQAARADIETHILSGVGHWAQYEDPQAVNGHILRFHGAHG